MEIKLIRDTFTPEYTLGKMYIDGEYFCETVEDTDRGLRDDMHIEDIVKAKVYGKTAIPYGRYKVLVNESAKFKRMLPLLVNVKGYAGIRIHRGNNAEDSLGCILPGLVRTANGVGLSTKAELALMKRLEGQKEVYITITKA